MRNAPPVLDEARLYLLNTGLRLMKDELLTFLYKLFQWTHLETFPTETVDGITSWETEALRDIEPVGPTVVRMLKFIGVDFLHQMFRNQTIGRFYPAMPLDRNIAV